MKFVLARFFLSEIQERVGSSIVEAMLSRAAPVFYGDIRGHERVKFFSLKLDILLKHFMVASHWWPQSQLWVIWFELQVQVPFSKFIGYCHENIQNPRRGCEVSSESERHELEGPDTKEGFMFFGDAPQQIYLAQVTTWRNSESAYLGFFELMSRKCIFIFTVKQ